MIQLSTPIRNYADIFLRVGGRPRSRRSSQTEVKLQTQGDRPTFRNSDLAKLGSKKLLQSSHSCHRVTYMSMETPCRSPN